MADCPSRDSEYWGNIVLIAGLAVSGCIYSIVTEHSLNVRGEDGLSGMVHLQSIPQMNGCIGLFLTSIKWQKEHCIEKSAFVAEPGGKACLNYVTF